MQQVGRATREPGAPPKEPKPSKYKNKKTEYNGVIYDSDQEAQRAMVLDGLKADGEVAWWLRQVWIQLGPDHRTRLDFQVAKPAYIKAEWKNAHDADGESLIETASDLGAVCVHGEDVKGAETPAFKKTRKLWKKYGPFPLYVVKTKGTEIIEGKKK